jgi:hypothetical protein
MFSLGLKRQCGSEHQTVGMETLTQCQGFECTRLVLNTADESRELCPRCLAKEEEQTNKRKRLEVEYALEGVPRNAWPFSLVLRTGSV